MRVIKICFGNLILVSSNVYTIVVVVVVVLHFNMLSNIANNLTII